MRNLPQIYCDMDGVLADFKKGAEKATGVPIKQWMNLTKDAKYKAPNEKPEQKEELNKDDKKVVTKVKDMLKKASQAHAGQAKELDKAMKTEKDNYGNEINKAKHAAYKDPKRGEHEPVDPKPSLKSVAKTVKEMMRKKKDDVATMADTEKEKEKKTTLVGSKKTPVDTKPEVEYKN